MTTNLETQKNYENPLENIPFELSDLVSEIKENNGKIPEKEKEEYKRLNIQFDNLMTKAKVHVLSYDDKKFFKQKGMSYIYVDTTSPFGGNSLAVYSKSNDYKPLWLRKNDVTKEERPDIFLNDLLRWGKDKKQLSVEQYKGMIEKIWKILQNQEKYLFEKRREAKNKKDKETDDMINNL